MSKYFSQPDTWTCTDALGRTLPDYAAVGSPRTEKKVGIFYHTWHHTNLGQGTQNVSETIRKFPESATDVNSEHWGPYHTFFWDEPIHGYYTEMDKWVMRKHAEMLGAAGVDFIVFDGTNGCRVFLEELESLATAFLEAKADGVKVPQFAYLLPWGDEADFIDMYTLYDKVYSKGLYKDLWFCLDGKPLVLGTTGFFKPELQGVDPRHVRDKDIVNFFTFRACQSSYYVGQTTEKQWGWCAAYPQTVYKVNGKKEQITVSPAQNYHDTEPKLTAMNGTDVHGRTWSTKNGGRDTSEGALLKGINFIEEWEYALEQDPEVVFVTGWNEWIAGRFPEWQGVINAFPDEYNDEFSRDIEPTKGILKDNYYYQLCSYIRKFKGVSELPKADKSDCSSLMKGCANCMKSAWAAIGQEYSAFQTNKTPRDAVGFNNIRYINKSGRNIFTEVKAAYDGEAVYFTATTKDDITDADDRQWMNLILRADVLDKDGNITNVDKIGREWCGLNMIVNRIPPEGEKMYLERSMGGYNWALVGDATGKISGNRIVVRIPFESLGVNAGDDFSIHFKWADNYGASGDPMDLYNQGTCAPIGRFTYNLKGTR